MNESFFGLLTHIRTRSNIILSFRGFRVSVAEYRHRGTECTEMHGEFRHFGSAKRRNLTAIATCHNALVNSGLYLSLFDRIK